jgi:hypothetical protein
MSEDEMRKKNGTIVKFRGMMQDLGSQSQFYYSAVNVRDVRTMDVHRQCLMYRDPTVCVS